jgi:hypothetical protein
MDIPELKEMTMDYLINKVYFDVCLNFEYDNTESFDIEFSLYNSFFKIKLIYICQSPKYCDIPPLSLQKLIDENGFKIRFNDDNDENNNNCIYSSNEHIYFQQCNYEYDCPMENVIQITKKKAIPVLKKLINMLNAVQNV